MERFLTFLTVIASSVMAFGAVGVAMTTPFAPLLCSALALIGVWFITNSFRRVRARSYK